MERILLERDQHGIVTLTLNRPEVRNAFDGQLIKELIGQLRAIDEDPAVRALILTGADSSFSAGADLGWMHRMVSATPDENERDALELAELMRVLNFLAHPTVARVNGSAFGGGIGLMACCDIAISVETARFGMTETRLGLAPAVISPYVIRKIGLSSARRYFQTGEQFTALQAFRMGLVSELCSADTLDATVSGVVSSLLKSGPEATSASKRLAFRVAGIDRDAQFRMDLENARLIAQLRQSPEGREGLEAFLEKRQPSWVVDTHEG